MAQQRWTGIHATNFCSHRSLLTLQLRLKNLKCTVTVLQSRARIKGSCEQ